MKLLLPTILLAFCAAAAAAAPEKRPTKIWNLTGPVGETPKHVTDAFPLSDQQNKGQWIKFEPMTDEFEGQELDRGKWVVGKGFENKYNMTVHVWQTPQEKTHRQVGGVWVAPFRLADDYHIYGFQWDKEELRWYVDGVAVRTVENTHWHQPLYLTFDSETMPEWMGMPDDKDLPSTFSVDYVRARKKK